MPDATPEYKTERRDIIMIGASAGGLQRACDYDEDAELVCELLRDHTGVVETGDTEQDAT